jgi:hypothetical protein
MLVLVVLDGRELIVKHHCVSKSARTEENASRRTRASVSTAGSTPIARRPFARRRVVMVAIARGRTRARAPRNGVEKTVAHPSVNRNARMVGGASRRTLVSARPSGTGTIVGCLYVIKVNLKLMGRRKRVLEYQKATLRSVWTYAQERGPCTGRAFLKSGVMRPKASTVRNLRELTPLWRPSPVRTIST